MTAAPLRIAALLLATLLLAPLLLAAPATAMTAGEQLADPAQEARARTLSRELRCPVCESASIDESEATLAADLRRIVRERIVAGDSDAAIRDYLRARYGDSILLSPPLGARTVLLWSAPPAVLLLAAGALLLRRRRPAPLPPDALTPEEAAALAALSPAPEAR